MPRILHYTVGRNRTAILRERDRHARSVEAIRPLLVEGTHELPVVGGYELIVDHAESGAFWAEVVHRETPPRPCVRIGIASTTEAADELWPVLESYYLGIGDLPCFRGADLPPPHKPSHAPWVSTVGVYIFGHREDEWLMDFGKQAAFAWLQKNA